MYTRVRRGKHKDGCSSAALMRHRGWETRRGQCRTESRQESGQAHPLYAVVASRDWGGHRRQFGGSGCRGRATTAVCPCEGTELGCCFHGHSPREVPDKPGTRTPRPPWPKGARSPTSLVTCPRAGRSGEVLLPPKTPPRPNSLPANRPPGRARTAASEWCLKPFLRGWGGPLDPTLL